MTAARIAAWRRASAGRAGVLALAVASGLWACTAPPAATRRPALRVAHSALDFDDMPSYVANATLEADGYQVEDTSFALTELAVEALARGNAEFASGSVRSFWVAAARGAPVLTVMAQVGNMHRLVVRQDVSGCRDLEGRRLALQSEGAIGTAFVRRYFAEACPKLVPQTVFVPQSENRAAALLSGHVDATVLELAVYHWLDRQAPGRFRVLEDFSTRWPDLIATVVNANSDFAKQHPAAVRDYVRARVLANRAVSADPSLLVEHAKRAFGDSEELASVAKLYGSLQAFDTAGGLTAEGIAATLTFLQAQGELPHSVVPAQVADLSFLVGALRDLPELLPRLAGRWPG